MDHGVLVGESLLEFAEVDVDIIEDESRELITGEESNSEGNGIYIDLFLQSLNGCSRDAQSNVAEHLDDAGACAIRFEEQAKY